MPCAYYHAVRSELDRGLSGVMGYCWGCSSGEVRVPSLAEYHKYCTSADPTRCPVHESREIAQEGAPSQETDWLPRA